MWMGLGWMNGIVNTGQRSSKSTYGANKPNLLEIQSLLQSKEKEIITKMQTLKINDNKKIHTKVQKSKCNLAI